MPFFFQFSKNGRHNPNGLKQKKKNYLEPNNSTMNRICKSFDDIGKIDYNYANIPSFNYQMLLDKPSRLVNSKAIELFCELDDQNTSNVIQISGDNNNNDMTTYDIIAEQIKHELTERYGSLKKIYPVIAKYLFAGENIDKQSHKQMFWRVFGDIALNNLINNSIAYTTCDKCGTKIPIWSASHECSKATKGYFECCDCGVMCQRVNPKQKRCPDCQTEFKKQLHAIRAQRYRDKKGKTRCTTF